MSNTSLYPNAIDGFSQIPLVRDKITQINADGINRLRSAIINIETALGTIPNESDIYGDFASLSDRLAALDLTVSTVDGYINDINSSIESINTELSTIDDRITELESSGSSATIRVATSSGDILIDDYVVLCNTSSSSITLLLPAATDSLGRILRFKKIHASNSLIIDCLGADTIDDNGSYTLEDLHSSIDIISDGLLWYIVG